MLDIMNVPCATITSGAILRGLLIPIIPKLTLIITKL
jgi:hypothetical protein